MLVAAVTVGFTWAKIDSWDSEYFYVKADAVTVHTSAVRTACLLSCVLVGREYV